MFFFTAVEKKAVAVKKKLRGKAWIRSWGEKAWKGLRPGYEAIGIKEEEAMGKFSRSSLVAMP